MVNTKNFILFVNERLVKDGKDGVRFIALKASFLVHKTNSDFIRKLKCVASRFDVCAPD